VESRALLDRLDRHLRRMSARGVLFGQAVADRLGIGASDLECLDLINLKGRVTAGELAAATGLTTGAITGVLDRLEKAGFIKRERDAADRRKVFASIRPAALQKIAPLYQSLDRAMRELWSRYSREELELLIDFAARCEEVFTREIARLRENDPRRRGARPARKAKSKTAGGE